MRRTNFLPSHDESFSSLKEEEKKIVNVLKVSVEMGKRKKKKSNKSIN
jgi:hypothetical protein